MTRTTVKVRFLVPRKSERGGIDYCVETHAIRLPLRRGDRLELRERLDRPPAA